MLNAYEVNMLKTKNSILTIPVLAINDGGIKRKTLNCYKGKRMGKVGPNVSKTK